MNTGGTPLFRVGDEKGKDKLERQRVTKINSSQESQRT